jgi:hypothetical protein
VRSAEEVTMFVPEPFARFEPQSVAPLSARGIPGLAAVLAIGFALFVVMLAAAPGFTRICPAPHAGTPVHLAR